MTVLEKLTKACNQCLFVYLYPGGDYQLTVGSLQHRDLVRTFFAGAMEGWTCKENSLPDDITGLMDFYEKMCAEDWRPGTEFYPTRQQLNRWEVEE